MRVASALLAGCLFLLAPPSDGADSGHGVAYQRPPEALARLVDAPRMPEVRLAPDRRVMALLERPPLTSIAELARPEVRLAGLRIDPVTRGPSREIGYRGIAFLTLDGAERPVVGLPAEPEIRGVEWSPDGRHLAFLLGAERRVELWVADREDGAARRLLDRAVADAGPGASFRWLAGGGEVVVRVVPAGQGAPPASPAVPRGPVVEEVTGEAAPAATFQDLLASPHDEDLFDHYLTAELVRVALDGTAHPLAGPAVYTSFAPSPDGRYLLTQARHRPYSYLVPWYRFANRVEVWDVARGTRVHEVADVPVQESLPLGFGSVETGPREFEWRADEPAVLAWAEAQDGGDIRREADIRDRLYTLAAPFDGAPRALVDLPLRFLRVTWGDDETALVEEFLWQTRTRRGYRVRPADPGVPDLLWDVSFQDLYNDPGRPLTVENAGGHPVLQIDDGAVFMAGDGASAEGNRPFLRRLDLATGATTELFRSAEPHYEEPVALLDLADGRRLLTRRESVVEPPNLFLRDLAGGEPRRLTDFPHPYPELAEVQKEVLEYTREDGIPLSATLYLPAGYEPRRDGPLPALVWAYPEEFKSAADAGQRDDSPFRFTRVSYGGPVGFVTRGYAVLDDASMPIVGEGEAEPNDRFVEQLVASAAAAIAEGARRGVVDPERVAVGGHSYGAFMTANLLAHSDLFRAGIARSGAYNRTLTPFGFQAEERLFWEAPEVYFAMSPFMHADEIDEPLLLIHGAADNNPGTHTMQSERFYRALQGHGARARLVLLPHESHGYRARESVLHMLWEEDRWLEEHVKNAPPREDAEVTVETGDAAVGGAAE